MRRFHLLCSAILLLASSSVFAETTFKLQTVRVIGSQRFREDELVAALGLGLGNEVNVDMLKKAADRLMETGALAKLEYKYTSLSSGVSVEYQVSDASDFLPCRYENIVWMGSQELTTEVHELVPLFNGETPTSGTLVDQVAEAISAVLERHGVTTKVRYELHSRGIGSPVDAILFVSDTVKPKVQEVILSGANLLTPGEKMENTKRLVGDDYLATRVRESLANALGFLYGNRGYLRLQVGEPQPVFVDNPQTGLLRVTVPVNEGAQYRVKSIAWSGAAATPAGTLDKLLQLHQGEIADQSKLDLSLAAVLKSYRSVGYMTAKVQPVANFTDNDHSVAYDLKVTEGDLFHMGNLSMQGLDPSVLQKLQKNWKLTRGDVYNGEYVQSFVKQNAALINGNGRPKSVKIQQIAQPEKVIDVTIDF